MNNSEKPNENRGNKVVSNAKRNGKKKEQKNVQTEKYLYRKPLERKKNEKKKGAIIYICIYIDQDQEKKNSPNSTLRFKYI